MASTGIMGAVHRICEWIMRLAYVNILWITFTLIGLIIFGLAPATVSMFAVMRKFLMGKSDVSIFSTYWKNYKKTFIQSNLLGYLLVVIGLILILDIIILKDFNSTISNPLLAIFYGILIIYFITVIYFFPIYVHFKFSFFQYLKYAILIGLSNPFTTVLILVGIYVEYFILQFYPLAAIFFSGSLLSLVIMWGGYRALIKTEKRIIMRC